MKTSRKPARPRRIQAVPFIVRRVCSRHPAKSHPIPLWELPRTAKAYDQMVEQMEDAWGRQLGFQFRVRKDPAGRAIRKTRVAAMLCAIGITRPKETKL